MKKDERSDTRKPDQRLGRQRRLRGRKVIGKLFREGQVTYTGLLRLHYLVDEELQEDRVMVVVGKRYLKKAVARNKVRRRVKEAYRIARSKFLGSPPCYQLALVYHRASAGQLPSYQELSRAVEKVLERVKEIDHKGHTRKA